MKKKAKQRVLLKISGEMLCGKGKSRWHKDAIQYLASEIHEIAKKCELGIVIGGGNVFRRSIQGKDLAISDDFADWIGMLATAQNALVLMDVLENLYNLPVRHQSAIEMIKIAEPLVQRRAIRHLEKGRIVIFSCGMGEPSFTTDTTMVHAASKIGAQLVLKGTKVDGIYDQDPEKYPDHALFLRAISYQDFIARDLGILDTAAVALARDKDIAIHVFNIFQKDNLKKVIEGDENIGSVVGPCKEGTIEKQAASFL